MSPLGSGSHFPFSVHVAVSDPINSNPGEQLKVTVLPSTGIKSSVFTTFGTDPLLGVNNTSGCPQLAMESEGIRTGIIPHMHGCAYTPLYYTSPKSIRVKLIAFGLQGVAATTLKLYTVLYKIVS